MKAVLISIKPKYCELIANGKKTVEVRKKKPKIDTPFKCYIYCTKPSKTHQTICGSMVLNDDELYRHPTGGIKYGNSIELMVCNEDEYSKDNFLNGKVIGEFVCDNISVFENKGGGYLVNGDISTTISVQAQSCLTDYQFRKYAGEKSCYGWHISDLVIYDKPKELNEFYKKCDNGCGNNCEHWKYVRVNADEFDMDCDCAELLPITCPPQSWCYIEELED